MVCVVAASLCKSMQNFKIQMSKTNRILKLKNLRNHKIVHDYIKYKRIVSNMNIILNLKWKSGNVIIWSQRVRDNEIEYVYNFYEINLTKL